ncbi:MAG TPA: hypothetical protein VG818_07420, partial [Gemmatimonadaceae bacterium]|nr:hypothetical protein [Gemmatimonadaceae bacterium]
MCGFVGGVLSRAVSESDVRALATAGATLAHRGPDSDGLAVIPEARTVLAFRRLAIIALADGDQPMSTDTGQHIVFNGEIYNYRALRDALWVHDVHCGTA